MTTFDYYFFGAILVVLGVLIVLLLGAALLTFLEDFKWYNSLQVNVRQVKLEYKRRNKLYRCSHDNCKRLYRLYQAQLTFAVKNKELCPHCSQRRTNGITLNHECSVVTRQDKWMQSHIDCPAIGKREYHKVRKAIVTAEQLHKDEAAMKRFEEYNQFSVDVSWIKNLQKKE